MITSKLCIIAALALVMTGCARQEVIPEKLEGKVDRDLRFVDVKQNPEAYRGQLVLVGGKVLSAKQLENGIRMEVLQMPLSADLVPEDRQSHGRFIAMDAEGHVADPAVLNEHERVTVVGEVVGTDAVKIDEVKQEVPKFRVKHVTVWDRDHIRPYYGYRYPYAWGYGRYYGYPYYW
jgi:outer membrane lipoprotein